MSGKEAYHNFHEMDSIASSTAASYRAGPPATPKKKTWGRKKRLWTAATVLAVVITVAVAVPVVLKKRSSDALPTNEADRYNVMFHPQGYQGTNLNGLVSAERQKAPTIGCLCERSSR